MRSSLSRALASSKFLRSPLYVARELSSSSGGGGLSFSLSEDQRLIQNLARTFAREVMIPRAREYDLSMAFPKDIFKAAWEAGLVNSHVPAECGGAGLGA